jgi:hypothetical protein
MAEREEYTPQWGENTVVAGQYVWTVYLKSCVFRESVKDGEKKAYMQISAIVEDPPDGPEEPLNGTDFSFRVYMNQKAQGWCLYFLKKFGYKPELLGDGSRPPIIKRAEVAGLHGKVLVNVTAGDQGMLQFDVNGFDSLGGDELEKRLAAKRNGAGPAQEKQEATLPAADNQVTDLEADVKQTAVPDSLDDL